MVHDASHLPAGEGARDVQYLLRVLLTQEEKSELSAVDEEYDEVEAGVLSERSAHDSRILYRRKSDGLPELYQNAALADNLGIGDGIGYRGEIYGD